MKNHFSQTVFVNSKSYCFLILINLLMISNIFAKGGESPTIKNEAKILLPPPTPTVVVTPLSGANCYSVITASGCGAATTQWYSKDGSVYSLYSTINPLTVIMKNAVTLRAACYDASTSQYAYSADYKVLSATTTDILVTQTPTGCPAPAVGSSTTLLNASSSISGLSYQWKLNGLNIPGATASSYTATENGKFQLEVNNGVCNNTYQLPANIPNSTLTNINLIFYQPNVYAGSCGSQTVTLASNASSSSLGLSYQW
jgi:hypothetical protein